MRCVYGLAISITIAAMSLSAANAGDGCRKYKPGVGFWTGGPENGKNASRIWWEYNGPPACSDAVHLRFGVVGQPLITREVKTKGCGRYEKSGRPTKCGYGIAPLKHGEHYEVNAQECDKHATSSDECSAWSHIEYSP